MKFFSNKIVSPAGPSLKFEDWLKKFAGEAKPECNDDSRGGCRGQVINNDNEEGAHSYQEGESVDGKKEQGGNARKDKGGTTDQNKNEQSDKEASVGNKVVEARCGKEMGETDAGKVTEKHSPAAPGDDNSKIKQEINNDPNYQKGESVNPSKVNGKNKKTSPTKGKGKEEKGKSKGKGKEEKKSSNSSTSKVATFTPIAGLSRKDKIRMFTILTANKNNPIEYVEAMLNFKYANMTEEEKKWFADFWTILYPPEYVEEMKKDR